MSTFIFEPLRPRMIGLLLAFAASTGTQRKDGSVTIDFRLTQDRFAEMLGVTRQAVTLDIRGNSYRPKEKLKAGLVRAEEAEA